MRAILDDLFNFLLVIQDDVALFQQVFVFLSTTINILQFRISVTTGRHLQHLLRGLHKELPNKVHPKRHIAHLSPCVGFSDFLFLLALVPRLTFLGCFAGRPLFALSSVALQLWLFNLP